MSMRNMGQARNPKSPAAQETARFHFPSSSMVVCVGEIRIPATLPVLVWAYQAT